MTFAVLKIEKQIIFKIKAYMLRYRYSFTLVYSSRSIFSELLICQNQRKLNIISWSHYTLLVESGFVIHKRVTSPYITLFN